MPFNFHFKIGIENDIFVYFNFDSKLKIEKRQFSIFNFYWKIENKIFVFRFSIFILFQNTKLPLIKLTKIWVNPLIY